MKTNSNIDTSMKNANAARDIFAAIIKGLRLSEKCFRYPSYVITKAQSAASVENTAPSTT